MVDRKGFIGWSLEGKKGRNRRQGRNESAARQQTDMRRPSDEDIARHSHAIAATRFKFQSHLPVALPTLYT